MNDEYKTKEQLISQLIKLRERNQFLEKENIQLANSSAVLKEELAQFEKIQEISYFFDFSTDLFVIIGMDNTIKFITPNCFTLLGYKREEILKETVTRVVARYIHPDDLEKTLASLENIFRGGVPSNLDSRYRCIDGSYKWFSWTTLPAKEKGVVYLIGREVTDKKLVEEKLKRASERVVSILESISDSSITLDQEWKFIYLNRGAEKHFGKPREDLLGKNLLEEYPKLLGQAVCQAIEKVMLNQQPSHLDFKSCITKRWYEGRIFPTLDGVSVFFIDITERKKVQEELRTAKKRFLKIFNMCPYMMSINKLSDGRFIDVNKQFEFQTGYSRKEILKYTLQQVNGITVGEGFSQILKLLKSKGSINNEAFSYITKDGETRDTLVSAEIIDLDGEKVILASLNDITELKKIAEKMSRLDRLDLIGQMAAGIGHEIRNPLTTIRGTLQLLTSKEDTKQYGKYFITMIEEVDRCNSIISEFLALARVRPIHMEPRNINDIILSLYPLMLADALNQNKAIELRIRNIPHLMVDEKEIRQLILNLVRNGLEAMTSKGTIDIETSLDGDEVVLSIKDQGKGIESDVLKKIGTPFFTTKARGTGLGLAVCYSIAARHNANIEIQTNSKGTTFKVRFRIKDKP